MVIIRLGNIFISTSIILGQEVGSYQYIFIKPFVRPSVNQLSFVLISHTGEGCKHFYIKVRCVGGYDDVEEEMDVSEASKLSAGARIFSMQ